MKYTWRSLNESLATMPEHEVKLLLDAEMMGPKRIKLIERLHQRYNTLRVAREREELLELAGKELTTVSEALNIYNTQEENKILEIGLNIISNERNTSTVLDQASKFYENNILISQEDNEPNFVELPEPCEPSEPSELPELTELPELPELPKLAEITKNNNLKIEINSNAINKLSDQNSSSNLIIDRKIIQVGINDLEKHNEEAIFDALNYFNKKCPYCNKDQYRIGVRDKIEIDHFVPVSKGGQNVPWNLVPVCKECNRKKKALLPSVFLDSTTFNLVNDYLITIKNKFSEIGIYQFSNFQFMENLVLNNKDFIRKNISEKFITELLDHLQLEDKKYITEDFGSNKKIINDAIEMRGLFQSGAISSPLQKICDSIKNDYGVLLSITELVKLLKSAGWIDAGRIASREYNIKKQIFHSPNLNHLSKSKLRGVTESDAIGFINK